MANRLGPDKTAHSQPSQLYVQFSQGLIFYSTGLKWLTFITANWQINPLCPINPIWIPPWSFHHLHQVDISVRFAAFLPWERTLVTFCAFWYTKPHWKHRVPLSSKFVPLELDHHWCTKWKHGSMKCLCCKCTHCPL